MVPDSFAKREQMKEYKRRVIKTETIEHDHDHGI